MHANRFLAVLTLLLALLGTPAIASEPLRIGAAANLQKILTEALIPAFEKKTKTVVIPTFGSTKQLAVQLQNGAPLDVFVAADTATVDKLAAAGVLVPGTVRVYAIGRLVLWTRRDSPHHPRRLEDLADPVYTKIAIANPALAPYGLAAQEAFAKAKISASVAPKLVQAENIAQALEFAQSGNADVALTALSLVIDDPINPYVIVPDSLHSTLKQSAAVATASRHKAAGVFVAFLAGRETAPVWKRYGYELPKK